MKFNNKTLDAKGKINEFTMNDRLDSHCQCEKEKCAWWIKKTEEIFACAIHEIAELPNIVYYKDMY